MFKLTILVLIILADAHENRFCIHYLVSEQTVANTPARNPYTDCVQNMCTYYIDHVSPNECDGCRVNIQSVQPHINSSYSNRVKCERNDNKYISDPILFCDGNGNGQSESNTINMSHIRDIRFISDTEECYLPQFKWYNKIRPMSNISKDLNLWDINNIYNIYNINGNAAKTAEYLDEPHIGGFCNDVSGISVALCLILIFGAYIAWKCLCSSQQAVDIELKYGESLSPPLDWERDNNVTTSIPQQNDDNGHFEYPPWAEYAFIDQIEGRQDIEVNAEQEAININLMQPQTNDIHQDDGQFEYPPWAEYSDDL